MIQVNANMVIEASGMKTSSNNDGVLIAVIY